MAPRFSQLPYYGLAAGLRHALGTMIPPGAQVAAYVRSTGPQDGDDDDVVQRLFLTLNAGLGKCRSGMGDVVIVLPGHAENISSADAMSNLVAGTRIIGIGRGTLRPKLTWTAQAATFLFDVENVELAGFRLEMAGDPTLTAALTVDAPITISAAGCAIRDCIIRAGVDADQLATIPITTTAAADELELENILMYGSLLSEITTGIRFVGADRLWMKDCKILVTTSSTTVGAVQFLTTASTDILVEDCVFANSKAASVHAFTGMAGATGIVRRCSFAILDNLTLAGMVTVGNLVGFDNKTVNLVGEQGGVTTTVST